MRKGPDTHLWAFANVGYRRAKTSWKAYLWAFSNGESLGVVVLSVLKVDLLFAAECDESSRYVLGISSVFNVIKFRDRWEVVDFDRNQG